MEQSDTVQPEPEPVPGPEVAALVAAYAATGGHRHGTGECEDSMNAFTRFAAERGFRVQRHEFNYPLVTRFPTPHPGYDRVADEPSWDAWHHAASVTDAAGVVWVVDWTLRQFDPTAAVPHVEQLAAYSQRFAYATAYDVPAA